MAKLIAHYRGENRQKFVVTNKQWLKIDGFEQKSPSAHVPTSEESTKRTVRIQQWGSHPLSLAGWQGPARLFANLNDL
jgi:hypothetical protein